MRRVATEVQIEIEQFLIHEASLLEENRFDAWLDLLADDIHYFMPIRESVEQPAGGAPASSSGGFPLYDDDKKSLALRAARLQSRLTPSETPPPLVQRLITNIAAAEAEQGGYYAVRSNFLVHQERRGRHINQFIGRRDDLLRRAGETFQIARREIQLAQTLLPGTISLFF
ncbi:MAG TPA: aromatic-ring-hydroxylating dioxygenase subunit beta [Xanthobacteraceae bacterium]|jgi:3-phenylpropionate/cinnamic acid dioxygenase small subunit|nr:aromatic-ring-hydroxylating dioxygenase subunit beta [Xanthobacteraceae bacterium]